MNVKGIQIYGGYRTGTNLVAVWFNRAFGLDLSSNQYGHAHDFIDLDNFDNESIDGYWFIVTIKDPYAFAVSFASVLSVLLSMPMARWCGAYWTRMYRYWSRMLPPDRTLFVRFEDVLADSDAILAAAEKMFGVPVVGDRAVPANRIHPNCTDSGEPWTGREYYERRGYLERMTDEAKAAVTEWIDWDLAGQYGYKPEAVA